jgi:hypothetical protein
VFVDADAVAARHSLRSLTASRSSHASLPRAAAAAPAAAATAAAPALARTPSAPLPADAAVRSARELEERRAQTEREPSLRPLDAAAPSPAPGSASVIPAAAAAAVAMAAAASAAAAAPLAASAAPGLKTLKLRALRARAASPAHARKSSIAYRPAVAFSAVAPRPAVASGGGEARVEVRVEAAAREGGAELAELKIEESPRGLAGAVARGVAWPAGGAPDAAAPAAASAKALPHVLAPPETELSEEEKACCIVM